MIALQPKSGGKVSRLIILGYAIPTAIAILSGIFIWTQVQNLRDASAKVEGFIGNLEKIDDIALNAQVMSREARGFMLERSQNSRSSYDTAIAQMSEDSQFLGQNLTDPEQKQIFEEITQQLNTLRQLNDELISLVEAGKTPEAIQVWKSNGGRELATKISDLFETFRDRQTLLVNEVREKEAETRGLLTQLAVFSALTLIGSSIILGTLVTRQIAQQLEVATKAIVTSSSEIAATVAQQERASTQQAASVNETTTTMDELGASARQVMEQADSATISARQALAQSENGAQAVELTMESMLLLKEKVGAIAQQILRLSEQTNQIGNISTLVSDLANQTNMLALNAAVEAVRAGEHGRGFSVVASEIRKLADRSKQSAEKIGDLVADIQNAINSTVMVTDEGTKTVESGVVRSQETAEAFNGVRGAVDQVVLNNQQIALTIKQQVNAIQQVVEAMNSLNGAAQESTQGIGQVRAGTQMLNEAAQNLSQLI